MSKSSFSFKELKIVAKENKKKMMAFEKERNRKKSESEYSVSMKNPDNCLEIENLSTCFFTDTGVVNATCSISIDVPKGKIVGLVGESGCGKSVTSLSVMRLEGRPMGQIVNGEIRFNRGEGSIDLVKAPEDVLQKIRGNEISMIFQEPMTALNPVLRIGEQIDEAILVHNPSLKKDEVKAMSIDLLNQVGIANRENVYNMYPHELSGGMRQRIVIAIALSCRPKLIIADEPTTALDVTIQAQILDLLKELKNKINCSIMLITHDLGVIAEMADYVEVMYSGVVVEKGTVKEIFENPLHPYTKGLLASRPASCKHLEKLYAIPGILPDPENKPSGCYFRTRCSFASPACEKEKPECTKVSETHEVSCFCIK